MLAGGALRQIKQNFEAQAGAAYANISAPTGVNFT